MLLADAPLTFREFMTQEALPLATIFREIFVFLTKRPDAVLFGAHAVNAYCDPERMTQDVDVLSSNGAALAEDLRAHLAATFHVAVRCREIIPGVGFRIYQVQKPKNRHLVDVRQEPTLPAHRVVDGVSVVAPVELIAMKVSAMAQRLHRPKGSSDRTDLQRLLLTFPELKTDEGAVREHLRVLGASEATLETWRNLVEAPIEPDEDERDEA